MSMYVKKSQRHAELDTQQPGIFFCLTNVIMLHLPDIVQVCKLQIDVWHHRSPIS